MRPNRYERRHTSSKEERIIYLDNVGNEYPYKFLAKMSSFTNLFFGMLKNGFPVVVKNMKYSAWAFYPFFFLRADLTEDPLTVMNHERIHIRQQRELHIVFSLPLIFCSFWAPWVLWVVPFVPTLFYYLDVLRVLIMFGGKIKDTYKSFENIRKFTCFETEAVSKSPNLDYLQNRKFFSFIHYMGFTFKKKKNGDSNNSVSRQQKRRLRRSVH